MANKDVPLMAVEGALADHQAVVSNLLGARPKSMLWNALHDVRFLLMRMAHSESLNADCGGGSLASNAQLVFHMLALAEAFANDAEHDDPRTARHARAVDAGFLAGDEVLRASDFVSSSSSPGGGSEGGSNSASQRLSRGLADAAPMACLSCVLFRNGIDDSSSGGGRRGGKKAASSGSKGPSLPHPKRRWALHRERFLRGLIRCAGRRKACGVEGSGCVEKKSSSGGVGGVGSRARSGSASFSDWDDPEDAASGGGSSSARGAGGKSSSALGKRSAPGIAEHAAALRPMITLYAIFDALSAEYAPGMEDEAVEESAGRLVAKIEECRRARDICDLMKKAGVDGMDHDAVLEEFLRGSEEWCAV